ncbi:MAG TPA: hypothetical protein PLU21_02120 [Candidatus Saccharibacteria bacterium]|nr:hypothetical protein [Candidatus Saccharibacteria bacterium]
MARYHRRRVLFRHIAMLLTIPVLLTSGSYALFSQDLSVEANQTAPLYVSSEYLLVTYTKTFTNVSGRIRYNIGFTVRNNGPVSVTAWQLKFDLPPDWGTFTCATSVVCSNSGDTETIDNGSGNGTIAKNSTRTFTIRFLTDITDYTLQNVYVSGTYIAGFQTITGLSVTRQQGTRTRVGSVYQWPITFTITNTSGFNLSAWQITVPWTTARSVISLPPDVTYVVNGSSLLITSTLPINDGDTYIVDGVFGSTSSNWTIGGTIKGLP